MEWNLTVLFENLDDPRIYKNIEKAKSTAIFIEKEYKGKINSSGELLVLALYNKYKEEGQTFIQKFKNFLKLNDC